MAQETIRLCVPAQADYARSVRMLAANLAVVCGMSVDDVEDVRMAAEEGFVYSCATGVDECEVEFSASGDGIEMAFALGEETPAEDDAAGAYARLILAAVCDEFEVVGPHLTLRKVAGDADA